MLCKRKPKEEQKITEYAKQQDSLLEGGIRTLDNHHVKNQGERQIDDILYQSFIVHSYILVWFVPGVIFSSCHFKLH